MIKKHFILLLLSTTLTAHLATTANAQTVIGMGTDQPNPNAVLELVPENGNQGFLAPRLTTAQRQASSFTGKLTRADHGLLVFDTNEGKFYYWFEGSWRAGTPGESTQTGAGVAGTTWYAGTTAPSGIDAAAGDFYINEITGEVFKFDGNAFTSMGSLSGAPGSAPNLSTVLQRGGSAGNEKITDLGTPTQDDDAATKGYVDTEMGKVTTPSLENVLLKSNSANFEKIVELGDPSAPDHAANKKYVDDQVDATRAYVDQEVLNGPGGGSTPSLEEVLDKNNSAANKQITDLAAPSAANHAANRKYVDDRDLENALDRDNDAGGNQITNLGAPTADDHAANQKYVKDAATISAASLVSDKILSITEGSETHTVDLSSVGSTPTSLDEGNFFVGDADDKPIPVTISGHITINASGVATITDAVITSTKIGTGAVTTPKIADGAVTKEKINADVAGLGLAKANISERLRVKIGHGITYASGGAIMVANPPAGYIAIGKTGSANDEIGFLPVSGDATLAETGNLTVKGLQGRTIANAAPSDEQVLQWDNDANEWAPASLPPGGGSLPNLPDGRVFIGNNGNQPTPTNISGDITIAANGTTTIEADVVDRNKINPDVAGAGLAQAGNGSLQVSLGGDVATAGSNLTVTKLQGSQVANTAPTANGQILTWNGTAWAPANPSNSSGGTWFSGANNPNPGNPSGAVTGDFFLRNGGEVFIKSGSTWTSVGYLSSSPGGGNIGSTVNGERQNGLLNTNQPTGPNRQVGTLWLDSSDDGSIKRWNGSSWVKMIEGDD